MGWCIPTPVFPYFSTAHCSRRAIFSDGTKCPEFPPSQGSYLGEEEIWDIFVCWRQGCKVQFRVPSQPYGIHWIPLEFIGIQWDSIGIPHISHIPYSPLSLSGSVWRISWIRRESHGISISARRVWNLSLNSFH